jgi:hypothetical protein
VKERIMVPALWAAILAGGGMTIGIVVGQLKAISALGGPAEYLKLVDERKAGAA